MEEEISESLKPTYKNVEKYFVFNILHQVMYNEQLPNFYINFREKEVIKHIEKMLWNEKERYVGEYLVDYKKSLEDKNEKVMNILKNPELDNESKPVMIVNNYKEFIGLLREGYEQAIELYFKECTDKNWENNGVIKLPGYVLNNYLMFIWQRMKPEDFNDPEKFLMRQNQMNSDRTLSKYDKEKYIGEIAVLDNNILCVKNGISDKWDESDRQMEITIYDKKYYYDRYMQLKPYCLLPLIRYGVYEKDGKKICHIGSIQSRKPYLRDDEYDVKTNINKKMNRAKFKANDDVPNENMEKVEPANILALSIFIDIMNEEGINDFEIQSSFVLDYENHEKRSKEVKEEFDKHWNSKENQEKNPEAYKDALYYKERNYNKQDIISEIKTERMIKSFERILYHYSNSRIVSYPGEVENIFHIEVPKIKSKDDIKGKLLKEIYEKIDGRYNDMER